MKFLFKDCHVGPSSHSMLFDITIVQKSLSVIHIWDNVCDLFSRLFHHGTNMVWTLLVVSHRYMVLHPDCCFVLFFFCNLLLLFSIQTSLSHDKT